MSNAEPTITWRITVLSGQVYLQGTFVGTHQELVQLSEDLKPIGMCIASPMKEEV